MKAKQSGFTLIELMFVVMLAALLLGLGIPSFRDFIRNGRITTAANDMVADYNLARSEAVKRRVAVTLCQSDDGATCVEPDDAAAFAGWIVFVDADEGGDVDAGEVVLRARTISDTIDVGVDGKFTTFRPSGFPDPEPGPDDDAADALTQVVMCDDRGNEISTGGVSAARGLSISATGRTTISRDKEFIEDQLGGCP